MGVIEGDLETDKDAQRIRAKGAPAVQISTGSACHLDAFMVHEGIHELPLEGLDLVFIENVGNLVCPASYDVGAHMNVVLLSVVEEEKIPIRQEVLGLCEFLGLEPYHLACEGRVLVAVKREDAEKALEVLKEHPKAKEASLIGYAVKPEGRPAVVLRTPYGTKRFLEPPAGELLPRIC